MVEKGGADSSSPSQKSGGRIIKNPTPHQPPPATALPHTPHPATPTPLEDLEMADGTEESPEMIRIPSTPPQLPTQPHTNSLLATALQRPPQATDFSFLAKPVRPKPIFPLRAPSLQGAKRLRPASFSEASYKDQLEGHLTIAITAIQAAQKIKPFYTDILEDLQRALGNLESPTLPITPIKPAKNLSFVEALQKGIQGSQWNIVTKKKAPQPKEAAQQPTQKLAQQPTKKLAKKPTQKPKKANPREGLQVILRLKKEPNRPTFNPRRLLTQLNIAIGARAIQGLELTARGNIAITTAAPYTAKQLLEEKPKWAPLLEGLGVLSVDIPTSWTKLVAQRVPNYPEDGPIGPLFIEDASVSGIEILGEPRWLREPAEGQATASVLFAVPTEAIAAGLKKQGLFIAGKRVPRLRP
ncbi:hypothetical protein HIM_09799 [Hirsutella minnesotensis 3608]|uniref:Uncharacterized protein n=1 Tax=Hirsutella minnesotensis 3608 TaxID=1043627 RepID=A0A0F7ZS63_9HYPO|nr:hypothetical protein HIM_09799 [Hirsutella minnesotensis 3608]